MRGLPLQNQFSRIFLKLSTKDRFFSAACILILTTLFISGIQKSSSKSDFQDYYKASQLFSDRQDIYQLELLKSLKESIKPEDVFKPENLIKLESLKNSVGTYIYPPTFAFLLLAVSWLSYPSASILFFLLNFIALVFSIFLIMKNLNPAKKYLILFLSLILNFRFLENHSNNNQVSFLLLALVLYSIWTKNDLASGILLSLAIVIKLTPGIFLLYFFYKKEFKRIGLTFLFLVVWVFLPFSLGFDYNLNLLIDWIDMVLRNFMQNPEFRAWKNNQSLIATLAKYFLPNGDPLNQATFGMPFITLTQKTVKLIFYALAILIFGGGFFRYSQSKRKMTDNQIISSLFILSIIFSGISWIHAFVFLLFPITYTLAEVMEGEATRFSKIVFWISASLPSLTGRIFLGNTLEGFFLMVSLLLYTSILLYFAVLFLKPNEA